MLVRCAFDFVAESDIAKSLAGCLKHLPFIAEFALAVRVMGAIIADVCCHYEYERDSALFALDLAYTTSERWGIGGILRDRLLSDSTGLDGWCQNDIARLMVQLPVTALYFLSSLRIGRGWAGKNQKMSHESCNDHHCFSDSIDSLSYANEHCLLCDEQCIMVGPDMDEVAEILRTDGIPIFRFKKSRPNDGLFTGDMDSQIAFEALIHRCNAEYWRKFFEGRGVSDRVSLIDGSEALLEGMPMESPWTTPLEIEVFRYDGKTPYVAFSHLWADGLGNVTTNTLPACRLPFLRRALWQSNLPMKLFPQVIKDELVGYLSFVALQCSQAGERRQFAPGLWDNDIPAFWIDTLGVPHDRDLKRKAIQAMSSTYQNAAKVLVIDSTLAGLAVGAQTSGLHCEARPTAELFGFLAAAPWMRRLWTLQEGLLAKQILIMFSEGPIDLENLLNSVPSCVKHCRDTGELVRRQLANGIANIGLFSTNAAALPAERRIELVWNASVGRTASKPGDATLCLATSLQIDPTALLKSSGDERVKRFYYSLPQTSFEGLSVIRINESIIFSGKEKLADIGFRWADKHITRKIWKSGPSATILPPMFPGSVTGLVTSRMAAAVRIPLDVLEGTDLHLWSTQHYVWLKLTTICDDVSQVPLHFDRPASTERNHFYLIPGGPRDVQIDWSKPSTGAQVGLLGSLERAAVVEGGSQEVVIERYVTITRVGEDDQSADRFPPGHSLEGRPRDNRDDFLLSQFAMTPFVLR
jgi:hypothetical protein